MEQRPLKVNKITGRPVYLIHPCELTGIHTASSLEYYLSGDLPQELLDLNRAFITGEIREYTFFRYAGEILGIQSLAGKVRKKIRKQIRLNFAEERIRKEAGADKADAAGSTVIAVAGDADPVIAEELYYCWGRVPFIDYWFLSCETGELTDETAIRKKLDKILYDNIL